MVAIRQIFLKLTPGIAARVSGSSASADESQAVGESTDWANLGWILPTVLNINVSKKAGPFFEFGNI